MGQARPFERTISTKVAEPTRPTESAEPTISTKSAEPTIPTTSAEHSALVNLPPGVLVDSYKCSHSFLYPPVRLLSAYGEFRSSFERDEEDHRILFYGLRYIIDNYVLRRWTAENLQQSIDFYSTHNANYSPYPFPIDLMRRVVEEYDGWLPVRIEGLAEATVIYPHTPVYVMTAMEDFAGLTTWLETIMSMVWYPTTVATLSRRLRDLIEGAFRVSVEEEVREALIETRLHDFGFRGCTCLEQAMIGGSAHLLNFVGSDTAAAAFHVQYHLNQGQPVAQSIPATEHSVMMAHRNEREAVLKAIEEFGDQAVACVMDSYDYMEALERILPSVANAKMARGGFLVLRPDSGDPVQMVLSALRAADSVFGSDLNTLGFRVIRGCGVIQGDGVNYERVKRILHAVLDAGYSAQNVSFGMATNLLQRMHRDTMSFATKLSHLIRPDGTPQDVCKTPRTDPKKNSMPGLFSIRRNALGIPTVYPKKEVASKEGEEMLHLWYDCGPINDPRLRPSFEELRARAKASWTALPPKADPISSELAAKIKRPN